MILPHFTARVAGLKRPKPATRSGPKRVDMPNIFEMNVDTFSRLDLANRHSLALWVLSYRRHENLDDCIGAHFEPITLRR
jgi:hypothetical protein